MRKTKRVTTLNVIENCLDCITLQELLQGMNESKNHEPSGLSSINKKFEVGGILLHVSY